MNNIKLYTIALVLLFAANAYGQFVPQGFNYQTIVRDTSGNALPNQTVSLIFALKSGAPNGPVGYAEKQVATTNDFGLVNIVIGQGTPLQGDFTTINWSGGSKFLTVSVETSPNIFEELGSTQLMSVPYAQFALNAGNSSGGGGDNWGSQTVQTEPVLQGNGTGGSPLTLASQNAQTGQVLKWDGQKWSPSDDVANNGSNGGTVTQINTAAGLTGGPISVSGTIGLTNTGVTPGTWGSASQIPVFTVDAQGRVTNVFTVVPSPGTIGLNAGTGISVQQNGYNFTITNTGDTTPGDDVTFNSSAGGDLAGNFLNLQINPGVVTTNEIQNQGILGVDINQMDATVGEVLKWNGSIWTPQPDNSGISSINITAGAGVVVTGGGTNFNITNSGDTNPNDDLTQGSQSGGDVSGVFSNLQIKNGAVGTDEIANGTVNTIDIADGAITAAKIDNMNAQTGQVLKWNGNAWVPQNDAGGTTTINPGAGIATSGTGSVITVINTGDIDPTNDITNTSNANGDVTGVFSNLQIKASAVGTDEIADDAVTSAKISDMGAQSGQVLKWNGTFWQPSNDLTGGGGSGGDNWGSQVVIPNPTLAGDGTDTNPLKLAQQGATDGQVLKWNGSTWAPATDQTGGIGVGDNWGTQVVKSTSVLSGDGTALNPLNFAQQGAATGQVLKWDGAKWRPADDLTGTGGGGGNTYSAGTAITITGVAPNLTINNAGDISSTNELQTIALNGNQLTLSQGGGTVTLPSGGGTGNAYAGGTGISITGTAPNFTINNTGDADNNATNELQAITLNGNQLALSQGGGTVTLPAGNTYSAGTGISITGNAPNFTINNAGDLDNNVTNELQTLALNGTILSISNGNTVNLSSIGAGGIDWLANGSHIYNGNIGNVLVGSNASATGKLQVRSTNTTDEAGTFRISSTASTKSALIAETMGTGSAGFFASTGGPSLVTGTGNVGINQPIPTKRLDVAGDQRILFNSTAAAPTLTLEESENDFARLAFRNPGVNTTWQMGGKIGIPGNAATSTEFALNLVGAATTRVLTANGLGQVGIGTDVPEYPLHVNGNNQVLHISGQKAFIGFDNPSDLFNGPADGYIQQQNESFSIGSNAPSTDLVFSPNNITSMTMKGSNGNIAVGAGNPGNYKMKIFHDDYGLSLQNIENNHSWEFWVGDGNGKLVLFNSQLPAGQAAGVFAINGTYTTSDRRTKKDIKNLSGVLDKIMTMRPVTFRYTVETEKDPVSIGFIAQDVQELFPELVTQAEAHKGQTGFLAVNYAGFGVLAIKAVQEQQAKITALEAENAQLKAKTTALEARMERLEQLAKDKN